MAITDLGCLKILTREKLMSRRTSAIRMLNCWLFSPVMVSRAKTAADLAGVVTTFGSLRQLFDADAQNFCATHGMGEAKYVQLQAVLEMSRRTFVRKRRGDA